MTNTQVLNHTILQDIATDSQDVSTPKPSDEEGCVEYILSDMKSDSLQSLEDKGMSQLELMCAIQNH